MLQQEQSLKSGIAAQGVHGIVSRSLIARGFAEKADKVNFTIR